MSRLPIRFRRSSVVAILLGLFGLTTSAVSIFSATRDAESDSTEEMVKEALHRGLYGLQAERDQLLAEAARQSPESGPANWHRGYVRTGNGWQLVDELIDETVAPAVEKEYQLRRAKLEDTSEGHLRLANWCRERGLSQQERAHLSRILDLNPDQAGIRERLGMRNVNGQWLTRNEALATSDRLDKEAVARLRWRGDLREIRQGLLHASPARRQAARERLASIQDPFVLPAMESILSSTSEECSLAVVDVASQIAGQQATDSLIRHAVFSPFPLVREGAAEKLRSRPRESFVPDLISEMYLPATSQFQWAPLSNGRLGYRHLIEREGAEQRQVIVLDTEYSRQARWGGDRQETLQRAFFDSLLGVAQREIAVSQSNAAQTSLNRRLADCLNLATGQQLAAEPQRWWQWWDQENDIVRQGDKQTRVSQQTRQVSVADRRPQFAASSGSQMGPQQRRVECFAAGTLVLTRRGLTPIEKVLVGDLVLSQHPESGELNFKPVLRTTVRPPGKLVRIQVGRDTLATSQGHLFWVSGRGWCKAQALDAGMQLHSLHGTQPISSIEDGGEGATYNLVVEDFHTYFVGEERVLSHDVTLRRPTSAIVPGLSISDGT